jgi:dihydroorotase
MTQTNPTQIKLTRPDDWHLHLRDDKALQRTVPDTARVFSRAIVMPNLRPPVTTVDMAESYRNRILSALPEGATFEPLMTLYLTDNISADEIHRACDSEFVHAVKLYPAGATTNSDAGVTDLKHCYGALEAMQQRGLPLLVHGEVTSADIDVFDREKVFIDQVLSPLLKDFPKLKLVFEHITTADAAQYVAAADDHIAATITPHHLLLNRNDLLVGGIHPHHYCLPVLKRNTHQAALIQAATSGSTKFFLGTDSAPHPRSGKETSCGCAGIYSALAAIEFYAEAFEAAGALNKLEGFASFHGPDFYGLPRNTDYITLTRQSWAVPTSLSYDESELVPLRAGGEMRWQVSD